MRRCKDTKSIEAANNKSKVYHYDIPIASVLHKPLKEWSKIASSNVKVAHDRKVAIDWKKFNTDDYLFTHCSIVSSVNVEDNGYYIKPVCNELVNSNGNAWSDAVLLACFRSFVNAENYLEHVQVEALSKGKLLDAVIRPVEFKDSKGNKANVQYVDILVATDRKHTDLIASIASGELSTLSMGCVANYCTCSRCGKVVQDSSDNCEHLDNELLTMFKDENGVERIVAELCGRTIEKDGKLVGDPDSVQFIEASWVENPAFKGAVINHYISDITEKQASVLNANNILNFDDLFSNLSRLRVADANGMLSLRVAMNEIKRVKQECLLNRIVSWSKENL